jgi:hypothetical protein
MSFRERDAIHLVSMLSAHTTNRKDGPLWPDGNPGECNGLCLVATSGRLSHSSGRSSRRPQRSDGLSINVRSDIFPNTNASEKKAFNKACLRPLLVLLRRDPLQVRLTASNFRLGEQGIYAVRQAAIAEEAVPPAVSPPSTPPHPPPQTQRFARVRVASGPIFHGMQSLRPGLVALARLFVFRLAAWGPVYPRTGPVYIWRKPRRFSLAHASIWTRPGLAGG